MAHRALLLRLGLALACSLALHAGLLLLPAPLAPSELGRDARLSVSLAPAGPRAEAPIAPLQRAPAKTAPVPPAPEKKAVRAKKNAPSSAMRAPSTEKSDLPVQPREGERVRRGGGPIVSASAVTAPISGAVPSRLDGASSFRSAGLSNPPRLTAPFRGEYPRNAFEAGRTGVVVVQLMIDEDGNVAEALALPGAAEDLAEAAVAALRRTRFRPAKAGDGPVRARAYFEVSFVIE